MGLAYNRFVLHGLVSTVIPVNNRASMLREAVSSVIAQTYRPIEVVIVDDGSTDNTPETISELAAAHVEVRAIRITNSGPGAAREAGRLIARGDYVQYLDSDDLLLPQKFESQVQALQKDPKRGVAYGWTKYLDSSGTEISCTWKSANQRQETILPSFLVSRWWDTPTPLYRRSITDKVGPWLPIRFEEDWEYDCRVGALGVRLAHVDKFVAVVRDHPDHRLSRGETLDANRLRDRAIAHEHIAATARRVVAPEAPELQRFGRELFHLGRLCGAAGLVDESSRLVALSAEIMPRWDVSLYSNLARILGWKRVGQLAMVRERM